VWKYVSQCIQYEADELFKMCLPIIEKHAADIFTDDRFLAVPNKYIGFILDCEGVTVEEIDLFNALIRWGKYQIKLKSKKGIKSDLKLEIHDLLAFIRMPLLSSRDIVEKVESLKIFNTKELIELYKKRVYPDLYSAKLYTMRRGARKWFYDIYFFCYYCHYFHCH
jgi:hypothetical protein